MNAIFSDAVCVYHTVGNSYMDYFKANLVK